MRPLILALPLGLIPALALAEVPQVVTDIPAVQSLAAQVMGDLGTPEVMLESGGNAHNYQMKPSQARALQNADLVFWVGPEMTPWMARAIESVALGGAAVELLESPGTLQRDFGGAVHSGGHDDAAEAEDHDHAHEDEHAEAPDGDHADDHEDHEDEDGHDHAHTGLDPHAWLDPGNAEAWLGLMAERLAAADPENAATYAANAAAAKAGIAALDAQLAAELAPVAEKPFVVFHAAYGYFAAHYGLNVAGSIALGDAVEPGAGHLADLRNDLSAKGVACVFPEAQHDPKRVALLVEGTDVRIGGALDPSGSALSYGPGLYAELMQTMADTLRDCLAQ